MKAVLQEVIMEFRTINRYPEYEISDTGLVRRKGQDSCRVPYFSNGHARIVLKGQTEYISRLVAETFIPNPFKLSDVRHKDGNKRNNNVWNLEWTTHGRTQKDSYGLGIYAPGGNIPPKPIRIIETGEEFPSIRSCARHISGTPSGIRQCLDGKINSYLGFHFELIF